MLIRTMTELESQGRVISISHGKSSAVRLLTKSDGVGFSVSEARASAGESSDLWYKNHWEANYIRSGRGVLEDRDTGEQWPLAPGVVYCVGPADRHRVTRNAGEWMRIISVFNPPLLGEETHDRGRRLSADRRDPSRSAAHVREDGRGRSKGGTRARGRGRCRRQHPLPDHRRQPRLLAARCAPGGRRFRRAVVQASLRSEPDPRRRPGRDRPCERRHPSTRSRRALSRRPRRPAPDRDARRSASHQRVQSAADREREPRRGRRLSPTGPIPPGPVQK